MRPIYPFILVLALLTFLFVACGGDEGNTGDAEGEYAAELSDSTGAAIPLSIESTAPELIGKWKLVNQRVGDLFISPSEIDEPVREFTADGKMRLSTNSSSPQTIQYTYLDGVISTLQEGDQYVSFLSADSLVLTETVDGVEAEYIFAKIP